MVIDSSMCKVSYSNTIPNVILSNFCCNFAIFIKLVADYPIGLVGSGWATEALNFGCKNFMTS